MGSGHRVLSVGQLSAQDTIGRRAEPARSIERNRNGALTRRPAAGTGELLAAGARDRIRMPGLSSKVVRIRGAEVVLQPQERSVVSELFRQSRSFSTAGDDPVSLPGALAGEKEEKLVLFDGAAQRPAKLILIQHAQRLSGFIPKECIGVEVGVSEVLEQRSVENVRTRLGDDIHTGAGVPAVAGVVVRCLHFEFLQSIGTGHRSGAVEETGSFASASEIRDGDAVYLKITAVAVFAVHINVLQSAAGRGGVVHVRSNSRRQIHDLKVVSRGERKRFYSLISNHASQGGSLRLEQRCLRCHFNTFGLLSDGKFGVQRFGFGDVHGHRGGLKGFESRGRNAHSIGIRGQLRKSVASGHVCRIRARQTRRVTDRHGSSCDYRAAFILHGNGQGAGGCRLRLQQGCGTQKKGNQGCYFYCFTKSRTRAYHRRTSHVD